MADRAGISKSYVSEIETGKKFPSGRLVAEFAKIFDVGIFDIIEDDSIDGDLIQHIEIMKDLPLEDQRAVARHALGLLRKDD